MANKVGDGEKYYFGDDRILIGKDGGAEVHSFVQSPMIKFTESGVPVLSVHDSFLIQHDKVLDLKDHMVEASEAVLGTALDFDQDYYDYTEAVQFRHLDQDFYDSLMSKLPEVVRTNRYVTTFNKFKLWTERNMLSSKPYRNVEGWIGKQV